MLINDVVSRNKKTKSCPHGELHRSARQKKKHSTSGAQLWQAYVAFACVRCTRDLQRGKEKEKLVRCRYVVA